LKTRKTRTSLITRTNPKLPLAEEPGLEIFMNKIAQNGKTAARSIKFM